MPDGVGLIPGPGAAVCLLEDVRSTGGLPTAVAGAGCMNAGSKGWGVGTWGKGTMSAGGRLSPPWR